MTTTSATRRPWTELADLYAAERDAAPDLLQRHLLCDATGRHRAGPDGRCRDCTKPLTAPTDRNPANPKGTHP